VKTIVVNVAGQEKRQAAPVELAGIDDALPPTGIGGRMAQFVPADLGALSFISGAFERRQSFIAQQQDMLLLGLL